MLEDTDPKKPVYPIFTVESDDPKVFIMANGVLEAGNYEEADICGGLFTGWDSTGRRLRLVQVNRRADPEAVITDGTPRPEELRAAIIGWANMWDPQAPLDCPGDVTDPIALYELARKHAEAVEFGPWERSRLGRFVGWLVRLFARPHR